jgi:hypothetical protein
VQVLSDGEVEVQLETRFPIFGGWKTQFHLGYSVPTENALTRSEDRYHLKVDFFAPFDNVWVEDLELKVRTWGCCVGCAKTLFSWTQSQCFPALTYCYNGR